MNINIENLPPMPFEADWEYNYGPVNEKWQESLASGVVYHFHEQWHTTKMGRDWVVYARPKPKPKPESMETCESLREFVAKVLPLLVEMRKNPETFSNTAPLIWDAVDEIQGKLMVK